MPPSAVNNTAHKARLLAHTAIPLLFAAIALPLIGQVYLALFEPLGEGEPVTNAIVHIIRAAPALILAWAVVGIGAMLTEYEAGRYLSLKASTHLKRASEGALVSLALQVLGAPLIIALVRGTSLWEALHIESFDLAVMMFASLILMVGGVLEAAAKALKADNDQIV